MNQTSLTDEDAKTKEIEGISTLHRGWHPASYIGTVWVKVIPAPENMGRQHCVKIAWGAYMFAKMLPVGESLNLEAYSWGVGEDESGDGLYCGFEGVVRAAVIGV